MKATDVSERLDRFAELVGDQVAERGALQLFFGANVGPPERRSVREFAALWEKLTDAMRAGRTPEQFGIYLHIPFCRHKCRYCIYYSVASAPEAMIDAYLERLHQEIDFYRPLFRGLTACTWYLGGGTPTLLADAQIERLVQHLDEVFPRREGGQWAFECNPLTVTEAKADLFARCGFNRVSFGVQSVRPAVLERAGRGYQTPEMVARTFAILKAAGFWVNADLLYGLVGDSPDSVAESLRIILGHGPDTVTLYDVAPGSPTDAVRQRDISLPELKPRLEQSAATAGYRLVCTDPTCIWASQEKAGPAPFLYDYSDMNAEPYSFLGLGPSARSYLYDVGRGGYLEYPLDGPFDPEAQIVEAQVARPGEEQRRYAIYSLEMLEGIDTAACAARFGGFEGSLIEEICQALVAAGRLDLVREGPSGRCSYRHAIADPVGRFVTALHFVDEAMIDATEQQVRNRAREAGAGDSLTTAHLLLGCGERAVSVVVAPHAPGDPCAHSCAGYCFFVPAGADGGHEVLQQLEAEMLHAFAAYFDRIVREGAPSACADLVRLLLDHSEGLTAHFQAAARLSLSTTGATNPALDTGGSSRIER